jgi:hypothetical protein
MKGTYELLKRTEGEIGFDAVRYDITKTNNITHLMFPLFALFPFISRPFPVATPSIMFLMASSEVGLHTVNTLALSNNLTRGDKATFSSTLATPPCAKDILLVSKLTALMHQLAK